MPSKRKHIYLNAPFTGDSINISDAEHTRDDRATFTIRFAPLMCGAKMPDPWDEWMAFDLGTIRIEKDRLTIDYEHNDTEILGSVGEFVIDESGLCATGELIPFADGDRASEVYYKLQHGVPYEASCFLDLSEAVTLVLERDQTLAINNQTIEGPCVIYHNAILRGLTICPYGRDRAATTTLSLGTGANINTKEVEEMDETNEEKQPDTGGEPDQGAQEPAQPELEQFIDEFGIEQGVAWFREGVSIEEAYQREHEALKSARIADEEKKEQEPCAGESEDTSADPAAPDAQKDKKDLSTLVSRLDEKLDGFFEKIDAIKTALLRGDPQGVTHGAAAIRERRPENLSAVERQAQRLRDMGTK